MSRTEAQRKSDLESALKELGADLSTLAAQPRAQRVRYLRGYIYDLRMASDADKLLFPQEQT